MKVLILGGTGAMGVPLVNLLIKGNDEVYVTSRNVRESKGNLHYIQGNAKDIEFFNKLMLENYDVIIDFMIYGLEEFKYRLPIFLEHAGQYFFFSSSRVYAESPSFLTEESFRLLDIIEDSLYLGTDEYALIKAREEDLLINSEKKNWTIIRPYITYNSNRLQLGVYEKENWLWRALNGKTIIFPRDIAEKRTTLTYAYDVVFLLLKLIGNEQANGEIFHLVTEQSATWMEILNCYLDVIEKRIGSRPNIKIVDDSKTLQMVWSPYQIKYDRLYNREFSNSKTKKICGMHEYMDLFLGLEKCVNEFLDNPTWLDINWRYEAWCDKITGERTSLRLIPGIRTKIKYIRWRYFSSKKS